MQAYENSGNANHATMSTDALAVFCDTLIKTQECGFEKVRDKQIAFGVAIHKSSKGLGFRSVAAEGFQALSVVVSFTDDELIRNGSKFTAAGVRIAVGVPLECGEGPDYNSFRIVLFGLDKLHHIDRIMRNFEDALDQVMAEDKGPFWPFGSAV